MRTATKTSTRGGRLTGPAPSGWPTLASRRPLVIPLLARSCPLAGRPSSLPTGEGPKRAICGRLVKVGRGGGLTTRAALSSLGRHRMSSQRWVGQSVKRVEDSRLLTGRGTFIDDHPPVANLYQAAIVRSPHAHARILGYDVAAALAMEGVVGVITGDDVAKATKPFSVGVTA